MGSELHPTASESRRSCGVDLGEMISLEETERDLKTMSSWVHLSPSARREIAQGLLTRASSRTRLKLRLHCFCDRSTSCELPGQRYLCPTAA